MPKRITREDMRAIRDQLLQHRGEEGWLGRLPRVFPTREILGTEHANAMPNDVKIARDNLPTNIIDSDALSSEEGNRAVGQGNLQDGVVALGKIDNALKGGEGDGGPEQAVKGIRKIEGSGASRAAAASNHNHSISFSHTPVEEQDAALALRTRLRGVADNPGNPEQRTLAAGILHLMHLLYDEYEQSGDARLEREKTDPAYHQNKEHERRWHDTGDGEKLQPKRHFEANPTPDLDHMKGLDDGLD